MAARKRFYGLGQVRKTEEKASMKITNRVYRFLRIFTVIHPGEGLTLFLLTLNIFLILTAYSILKPVRKALILTGQSAEVEAYLYGAMAIVLVFVIKAFSYLSGKFPRQLLITWVTLFFISNLIIFYVLHLFGLSMAILSVIFYIWVGIYNVFLIAQFWGFSNDIYTEEEGKRLFVLIMLGQNLGAVLGSKIPSLLVKPKGPFSPYHFLLLTGAILVICILLTLIIHHREVKKAEKKQQDLKGQQEFRETKKEKPLPKGGGFRLVLKNRYLLFIALVILMLNYVNTNGEYIKSKVWDLTAEKAKLTEEIKSTEEAESEFLTKIDSDFNFLVNIFAFFIQLFLVSRIFKWVGVRGALLFLPFIALGGYFFIAMGASFVRVKWAKIFENSTDYSLMNTTRGALFLITSREAKYKAKAAIDTFFVRTGDLLHSLTVLVGTTYISLSLEGFAKLNIALTGIWIIFCIKVIREHKKLTASRT